MLKNYFKIAWRNLWGNKTYSIINILGLTAGTVCCLYILLYIKDQYSFDSHHKDAGRIFRITTDVIVSDKTGRMATISPIIVPAIQRDFPEVEEAVRVMNRSDGNEHLLRVGEKSFYVTKGYYADSNFFNLFTYRFTQGNMSHCLDKPLSMVVSSSIAKRLFGNDAAVNKVITMTDRFGTNDFIITAVFDESYGHSHISPNFIMNIYSGRLGQFVRNSSDWAFDNEVHGYVKLKPNTDAKLFEAKLSPYIAKNGKEQLAAAGYTKVMHLQPIKDIHVHSNLNSEIDKNSNSKFLFILVIIAVFIQLIACINFMNLSTARSASRAKEIGVRKSAGAGKLSMITQFLVESLLISSIGIGIALPLLYALLPFFNDISQYNLSTDVFSTSFIWQIIFALIIITGLLSGSYPAFFLSSFKAIEVLKGNFRHHLSSAGLRKGLVVFQFMISIGLIIAVVVMRNQVKYMQRKDLGFNKEQKLVIPIRSRAAILTVEAYKNEIARLSEVNKVAGVLYSPGFKIEENINLYKQGKTMHDTKPVSFNAVDENYFDAMGIPLVAGRNFTKADTLNQVIINETAAKELGLSTSEAPGQNLYAGADSNMTTFHIVGVLKDFNFASLHENIKPLFFEYHHTFPNLIVSSYAADYSSLIAKLQTAWKRFNPQAPFEYSFLDENIQKQYETENTLLRIINSFTLLAVFICCLGLFGLAAFTAEQRVKEIGIRKVLGASVNSITTLLCKDFLKLVLISVVIISPLAYYFMHKWLQDFAYRVNLSWWVFVVSGTIALLIAMVTVSFQAIRAAIANPAKSLRTE
jgi:putative ABC transport system permease protein